MNYISIKNCKNGYVYKLKSRNLEYGIFINFDRFIGVREKFGQQFLDTEFHYSVSDRASALPIEEIEEVPVYILTYLLSNQQSYKVIEYLNQVKHDNFQRTI